MTLTTYQRSYSGKATYSQFSDNVLTFTYDSPFAYRWEDTIDKEVIPRDFRKLIRSGDNATTPLHGYAATVTNEPCHFYRKWQREAPTDFGVNLYEDFQVGEYFTVGPVFGTSGLSVESAKNQALSRFYSDLNAVETKFKGFVFTGELRESLEAIRHPARALRRGFTDYLNQIKRFGRIKRKSRQSAVRATWLEYSLGWSPLISDIDTAIDAFYASDCVRPVFEMVRGRGMLEEMQPFASFSVSPITNVEVPCELNDWQRTIVSLYGVYRHRGDGVSNAHHYGFRPSEFVPTLWELLPLSFVVDYFTNIGKILESWSYRFINPPWIAQTTVNEFERIYSFGKPVVSPIDGFKDLIVRLEPGKASAKSKTVTRTPSIPHAIPSLELKVPGRWFQWTNLAALTVLADKTSRHLLDTASDAYRNRGIITQ